MNYLLKIVNGVNAGAEIALAEGTVTFGSSDACDIVLSDASLPAEAFALEVSSAGVSLRTLPDGEAKNVDLYTLFTFGSSSFAVGENGAVWPELKSPGPPPAPEPPPSLAGGAQLVATADEPTSPGTAPAPARPSPETPSAPPPAPRRRIIGCLLVLLSLLIFLAVGYFLALQFGRFWSDPSTGGAQLVATADAPDVHAPPAENSLAAWAATNGLTVSEKDGETILSGNFAKRADRLGLAQDAYARDAALKLDLSDDETLKSGVEEVLFALTEGRVKMEVATNRVVKLAGRARSREELLHTVAAICTDVNRVRVVDDTAVVCEDGLRTKEPTRYQALSEQAERKHPFAAPAAKPGTPAPQCPVSGIILMPYPCLVLRDGSRASVGATVGEFKVEKIEADKVTLKRGEETVIWKP